MAGAIDQNQRAMGANQVAKLAIEGFGGAAFMGLTRVLNEGLVQTV